MRQKDIERGKAIGKSIKDVLGGALKKNAEEDRVKVGQEGNTQSTSDYVSRTKRG